MQVEDAANRHAKENQKIRALLETHEAILAFDGDCSLCNGTVRFILRWERKPKLSFLALQSEMGEQVSAHFFPDSKAPDSIILIHKQQVFVKSKAALRIAGLMGGIFRIFLVMKVLPLSWLDAVYDWVARNRRRWFGTSAYCGLNEKMDQERFLDLQL